MDIGYHASHEQFAPSELLQLAILAERAGFTSINCSDHFHPWSESQGNSGFSFAWLGAAMQATSLPFGVVCSPGQRYHPAIVAQAVATLCEMFEGRFWLSLGSGEALNENITGQPWPSKEERNQRLNESFQVIKKLLNGETVTHKGMVNVSEAKLYSRPKNQPLILGAALSEKTAEWLGSWAEGMITIYQPCDKLTRIIEAFNRGGGSRKPVFLQMQLSYARNYQEALDGAFDQWRTNILPSEILDDLWTPKQFEAAALFITQKDLENKMLITTSPADCIEQIKNLAALGFKKIILHNVNRDQKTFIEDFGRDVLPHLLQ